jgi:hypothetical protein
MAFHNANQPGDSDQLKQKVILPNRFSWVPGASMHGDGGSSARNIAVHAYDA